MRRGSQPTPPPPPDPGGEVFGPTLGAQSVRDGAGARPITVPPGAIGFASAADLAAKINANTAGRNFVATANIDWTSTISGGGKEPKIWIPNNFIMDGGARNQPMLNVGDGMELHGGIWQNCGGEYAPIQAVGTGAAPKLVQDVVMRNNFGKGLNNAGNNITVDHCTMHGNGRYGFSANEVVPGAPYNTNNKWQYCEWYNNNTRALSMYGAAGGTKLLACEAVYVGHCWAHDNHGSGLWFDFNPGSHNVEENVFENNDAWGMFYEVGTGEVSRGGTATASIHNNLLKNNVLVNDTSWFNSVQLLASCCDGQVNGGSGHEIHHNEVDGTTVRAMGFVDHNQPHPTDQKSGHFHDNLIWLRGARSGSVGGSLESGTNDPFAAAADNTFENNHYKVANAGLAYWRWAGADRTWAAWRSFGHDNTGSLEVI